MVEPILLRVTGTDRGIPVRSSSNELLVRFRTTLDVTNNYRGFLATYKSEPPVVGDDESNFIIYETMTIKKLNFYPFDIINYGTRTDINYTKQYIIYKFMNYRTYTNVFPRCYYNIYLKGCGGNIGEFGATGVINSPNFPTGELSYMNCKYRISFPPGFKISLKFTDVSLYNSGYSNITVLLLIYICVHFCVYVSIVCIRC